MQRICVYCGSSPGARNDYIEAAQELAKILVQNGLTLIYGGANLGIMGTLADAVLNLNGKAVGVMPHFLVEKEISHPTLTKLIVVDSMHERKLRMAELADGFIAMPGGLGTLEEIFEMLTWAQLGLHPKPCGFLNVAGYYDYLSEFLDHAVDERFLKHQNREMILFEKSPQTLLEKFYDYVPSHVQKWIGKEHKG